MNKNTTESCGVCVWKFHVACQFGVICFSGTVKIAKESHNFVRKDELEQVRWYSWEVVGNSLGWGMLEYMAEWAGACYEYMAETPQM